MPLRHSLVTGGELPYVSEVVMNILTMQKLNMLRQEEIIRESRRNALLRTARSTNSGVKQQRSNRLLSRLRWKVS